MNVDNTNSYTKLGPVAESYDQLHNLAWLAEARRMCKVQPGSRNSAFQAVFQSAEIALLNQILMLDRATAALEKGDLQHATEIIRWVHGFHLILRRLGDIPKSIHILTIDATPKRQISISESPALQSYVEAIKRFEFQTLNFFSAREIQQDGKKLTQVLGFGIHTDLDYALLNLTRAATHEMLRWEADLCGVNVDADTPSYQQFVGCNMLQSAVNNSQLNVETCYTEFVALHQIPELLGYEANNHIEQAVRDIRVGRYSQANEHLQLVNAMLPAMIESQKVMADCLSASDYHVFRDNLGPASGMHSLAIRYHMFSDLFIALWDELETCFSNLGYTSIEEAIRQVDQDRHVNAQNWQLHGLLNSAFGLFAMFDNWRYMHLHMPRNCLGGGGTKSMIGVTDGLDTVKKLRDAANALPALNRMFSARGLPVAHSNEIGLLNQHHTQHDSLDARLLSETGNFTRLQFPHVQEKSYCPFSRKGPIRRP